MRTLLAERFKLEVHRETRELDVYALVMARAGGSPGPLLKRSTWALSLRPFDEYGRALPAPRLPTPTAPAVTMGSPSRPAPPRTLPSDAAVTRPADGTARPAAAPVDPAVDGPFGAADGLLINGSVNNSAVSPFAQMAAFGNNRRGQRSLYNGGLGLLLGNSAWDARPFSFASQRTAKPAYNDVHLLATFGGPIRIPRWFRNGPTAFFGYQRVVDHNATTQSALVPSMRERAGDFSQSRDAAGRLIQIVDPATGRPFPENMIPVSQLSPQAQSLLNYYPAPNVAGDSRYNYETATVTASHRDSFQSRLSYAVNQRNHLFGSLSYQHATTDVTNLFDFTDSSQVGNLDAAINWSHRVSPFVSWRVRYQFTRASLDVVPYFANRTNVSGEAGITGNDQAPVHWGPPALTFSSDLAGLASDAFASNRTTTHAWGGEVLRAVGRNNLTVGGTLRPQHARIVSQQDARGTFAFTGASTGSDLADFLLGLPRTSSIAFGNADKDLRGPAADLFINDDWRATPTVTVTAGVRWEYEAAFTERAGRLVNLDIAPAFAAVSPVVAGDDAGPLTGRRYPASLLEPDWRGFQPRRRRVAADSRIVARGARRPASIGIPACIRHWRCCWRSNHRFRKP